jgi:hypothetical protein
MDDELIQRRKEELAELNEEMLFADGLEPALIGAVRIFNKTVALYDYDKCIEHLMSSSGSSYDEVVEHLEFNTLGGYVGENTPGFFVKTESFEPQRSDDDLANLHGQDLLDALTEARQKGNFKGWSFSEIAGGGSVLPMTVYDHEAEGQPITKHQGVVMVGNDQGKIASITVATTTKGGTEYENFVPERLLLSLQKLLEQIGQ